MDGVQVLEPDAGLAASRLRAGLEEDQVGATTVSRSVRSVMFFSFEKERWFRSIAVWGQVEREAE
jgi:hypothetical protein